MKESCYYCEEEGTTDEHVPPKCLFPEFKVFGKDYRKNLITVKSCEEHNCEKSGADAMLRQILVGSALTNPTGQGLLSNKWKRAVHRNPKSFNEFFSGGELVNYQLGDDDNLQTGMLVKKDFTELDKSLKLICAVLYFKETGEKLVGNASLITGFTLYLNNAVQRNHEKELGHVRNYFLGAERVGENPDIFYYHRKYTDNLKTFYLVFYEFNEVLVRYQ